MFVFPSNTGTRNWKELTHRPIGLDFNQSIDMEILSMTYIRLRYDYTRGTGTATLPPTALSTLTFSWISLYDDSNTRGFMP
jgi:hypothetical protein